MKKLLMLILGLFLLCPKAYAMYPFTFNNGTVADATEVNANSNYFEGKYSTTTGHRHDGTDSRVINTFAGLVTGTFVNGDLVFATDTNTLSRLALGTVGQVLGISAYTGQPAWQGSASGSGARAYASAGQNNTASGAYVKVNLDRESYDLGGEFDIAVNYRFTANAAGYYYVFGMITYYETVDAKSYYCLIYKNGITYSQSYSNSSVVYYGSVNASDIIYLDVGNYIELYSYHADGVSSSDILADTNSTYLVVFKMP